MTVVGSSEFLSLRAYAKHKGVSLQAVQRAIESHRISVMIDEKGKPKIDPKIADQEWEENTKHEHHPHDLARDLQKEVACDRLGKVLDTKPENLADSEPMTYSESRTVREAFEARLKKMEYEMKAGKLVSAEDVEKKYVHLFRVTRDTLLNIPDRISSTLAFETDSAKIHQILSNELHQALEELGSGKQA